MLMLWELELCGRFFFRQAFTSSTPCASCALAVAASSRIASGAATRSVGCEVR
jgi:hypothetical protein